MCGFHLQIKKLSRWEVIDVVRTMSTEQAKAGSDEKGMIDADYWFAELTLKGKLRCGAYTCDDVLAGLMSKIARGNRFHVMTCLQV